MTAEIVAISSSDMEEHMPDEALAEKLAHTEHELAEAEARYRLLLDSVKDHAIIQFDTHGIITAWNEGAETIFGFTEAEACGQRTDLIFTPEDRAAGAPQKELEDALNKGRTLDERWHLHKSGERVFVRGVVHPMHSDGKFLGFVKVARDRTEKFLAEEAIRHAKEAAETANTAKDRFLAVLSHELRNPLAPIQATAAFLLRDKRLPDDLREDIVTIQRNVQLEARLINDLLDVSRITAGKVHLSFEPVLLDRLVSSAIDICREEMRVKNLSVTLMISATRCCVRADSARVQQVLWNLIHNAIKFSPPESGINIDLTNNERDQVIVTVRDHGVGIADQDLERIFNPFEQAGDRAQGQGGLGLGLSIARGLAELHGGTLHAESSGSGKGSAFVLTLPLNPTNADCAAGEMPGSPAAPRRRQLTILLAEDDPETSHAMARLLTAMGHTVTTAGDVPQALALAQSQKFDLVISDIGLGKGSGLELMRAFREKVPHLRGIALSGYGTADDIRRSHEAGFDAHLVKPVDIHALEEAIAAHSF